MQTSPDYLAAASAPPHLALYYCLRCPRFLDFFGIVIGMFFSEHGVAHFHAARGEHKITVDIDSGRVRGDFPPRAQGLVLEWAALHEEELQENWARARRREPLKRIAPLE